MQGPDCKPQTDHELSLPGFVTRHRLNLSFSSWHELRYFLDWLAERQARPVYVLQRQSEGPPEAIVHVEGVSSIALQIWLDEAKVSGAVLSAHLDHLFVRSANLDG